MEPYSHVGGSWWNNINEIAYLCPRMQTSYKTLEEK